MGGVDIAEERRQERSVVRRNAADHQAIANVLIEDQGPTREWRVGPETALAGFSRR